MMLRHMVDRRAFLGSVFTAAAAAQERDWSGRTPVRYPEPAILALDKRFEKYKIGNTPIQRLHTGSLWAEGPAWNGAGRYLLWSDIPNNVQYRWLEEDGHVSVFRNPSGYSNGNTFDYEGRQISCSHGDRRVVRYEHDGTSTVIAAKWQGKPLNSPNDAVVHPDGSIWFTDPRYGILGDYEGFPAQSELKEQVYRVDLKTGAMDVATDEMTTPNGLCFSPDYRKLYISDSSPERDIKVWDVAGGRLRNRRIFTSMDLPGKGHGGPDGIRADADGNIWAAAGWIGPGYDGVHVFAPSGERTGMILLPEICANVCFGGTKRNRLFMASSQSLYAVYVNTRGAHIA